MASVGGFHSFFCTWGRVKRRYDCCSGHNKPQIAQDQDVEEVLAATMEMMEAWLMSLMPVRQSQKFPQISRQHTIECFHDLISLVHGVRLIMAQST
jgi:hypothetical protein